MEGKGEERRWKQGRRRVTVQVSKKSVRWGVTYTLPYNKSATPFKISVFSPFYSRQQATCSKRGGVARSGETAQRDRERRSEIGRYDWLDSGIFLLRQGRRKKLELPSPNTSRTPVPPH